MLDLAEDRGFMLSPVIIDRSEGPILVVLVLLDERTDGASEVFMDDKPERFEAIELRRCLSRLFRHRLVVMRQMMHIAMTISTARAIRM